MGHRDESDSGQGICGEGGIWIETDPDQNMQEPGAVEKGRAFGGASEVVKGRPVTGKNVGVMCHGHDEKMGAKTAMEGKRVEESKDI